MGGGSLIVLYKPPITLTFPITYSKHFIEKNKVNSVQFWKKVVLQTQLKFGLFNPIGSSFFTPRFNMA